MMAGGVTEIIGYFAGYFHTIEELTSSSQRYDGFNSTAPPPGDDLAGPRHGEGGMPQPSDGASSPVLIRLDNAEMPIGGSGLAAFPHGEQAQQPLTAAHPSSALSPIAPGQGAGGGGGGGGGGWDGFAYKLVYEEGGSDKFIAINQLSTMNDDDVLLARDHPLELTNSGAAELMSGMQQQALGAVPADLVLPGQGGPALVDFIAHRDAEFAAAQSSDAPHEDDGQLHQGHYVNGELQEESAAAASWPQVREQLEPPAHEPGQGGAAAVTGSNQLYNAAVISDLSGFTGTMLVHGNYYETNAIVQTNVLSDEDSAFGASGAQSASAGSDVTDNSATFDREPILLPRFSGGADSLYVHVQIVDGDYYNVKWVNQTNVMSDNDVVTQTVSNEFSYVLTGDNEQVKTARLDDLGHYDLIITYGDFHQANLIYQLNILNDNDTVLSPDAATTLDGADAAGGVTTGDNVLLNHASITNYGSDDFVAPGQALLTLSERLANQEQIGPEDFAQLTPAFPGYLNILVVTGSYYDINLVTQVNLLSDADTAGQYMTADASATTSTATASTGSNTLTNAAEIVTVGSVTAPYVVGDHYQDSILVQANLLPSDAKPGVVQDTSVLVTEAVAFTVSDHVEDHQPVPAAVAQALHHDILAGVLN